MTIQEKIPDAGPVQTYWTVHLRTTAERKAMKLAQRVLDLLAVRPETTFLEPDRDDPKIWVLGFFITLEDGEGGFQHSLTAALFLAWRLAELWAVHEPHFWPDGLFDVHVFTYPSAKFHLAGVIQAGFELSNLPRDDVSDADGDDYVSDGEESEEQ